MSHPTSSQTWRHDTLTPSMWYHRLSRAFSTRSMIRSTDRPNILTDSRLLPENLALFRQSLQPIAGVLEQGPGFVVIESPRRDLDDRQRTLLYWLLGLVLGRPVTQNIQGTLLYDVRDTGQDIRYGARFSITNAESSFHTDASFFDEVVDYVGLLCLKPSLSGGVSQVVNGNTVSAESSSATQRLCPFWSSPSTSIAAAECAWAKRRRPAFQFCAVRRTGCCSATCATGSRRATPRRSIPSRRIKSRLLDALDAVLGDPALRVEFTLRPGEMFFLNNRWCCTTARRSRISPSRNVAGTWFASGCLCLSDMNRLRRRYDSFGRSVHALRGGEGFLVGFEIRLQDLRRGFRIVQRHDHELLILRQRADDG